MASSLYLGTSWYGSRVRKTVAPFAETSRFSAIHGPSKARCG